MVLDFASGLNPLGPSPGAVEAVRASAASVGDVPEPGCPRLVERLAELHGVPADRILVGAGSTEIISLVGQSLRAVLALHARELGDPGMPLSHLVEPTRRDYRWASVRNDLRTNVWSDHVLGWSREFLPRSAAGIFWTGHPCDPTGRAWDRDKLLALVEDTEALLTVVDESDLPLMPDEADRSVAAEAATRPNLLVLRSLSRSHALPGLRVGYAVASADLVTRLRQYQCPRTVSATAEAAALAALDDPDHLARAVALIAKEAPRMLARLWDIPGLRPTWPARERPEGMPPLPHSILVSLTETEWTAPALCDALAGRGLLVRDCSNLPGLEIGALLTGPDQLVATRGHLRFAARLPAENDRLLDEVEGLLASEPTSSG